MQKFYKIDVFAFENCLLSAMNGKRVFYSKCGTQAILLYVYEVSFRIFWKYISRIEAILGMPRNSEMYCKRKIGS